MGTQHHQEKRKGNGSTNPKEEGTQPPCRWCSLSLLQCGAALSISFFGVVLLHSPMFLDGAAFSSFYLVLPSPPFIWCCLHLLLLGSAMCAVC